MNLEEVEREAFDAIEQEKFESAHKILIQIADGRSPYALLTLGWMYDNALAVLEDKEIAQSYYVRAVDAGSLVAIHRLGWLFLERGDEHKARKIFGEGAEKGNISCMYEFGVMMVDGKGGEIHEECGKNWLTHAADQGHFWSKRKLLGIEKKQAKSILYKMYFNIKIIVLGIFGGVTYFSNPNSERIR